MVLSPAHSLAQGDLEYPIKTAYLVRLALYVEWPAGAFESATSPLVVCVAGADPFGEALDKAAGGQPIDDRPVVVRRLKTIGRDSGCHIAYLGGTETQRPAQMVEALRGSHILTVSDEAHRAGTAVGIIHFVIRDNRVRLEIDDAAAARSNIAISSKLLGLALRVKPRRS